MSDPSDVLVHKGVRLDFDRLRHAVREGPTRDVATHSQLDALAELQACRSQVATPLDPQRERPPSQSDRSRLVSSAGITVVIDPDPASASDTPSRAIRLGPDLVSVAIALSDELRINEIDAAVLLYDARDRAARRPDHDVVAAAKELFVSRRRESMLYLQEIIRAGLNDAEGILQEDTFVASLLKERDILLTEHNVFQNLIIRLTDAFQALSNSAPSNVRAIAASDERLLLAETIFLLAYTVQLEPANVTALYSALVKSDETCNRFSRKSEGIVSTSGAGTIVPTVSAFGSFPQQSAQISDAEIVCLSSVRSLLYLAWTTALDRSRYQNMYNPRTGETGVNTLLKDSSFVNSTCHAPKLIDGEEDPISQRGPALAAAELSAALFRLAVAVPDEDEAVTTFLRSSAYGDAFSFLTDGVLSWIEEGAGSLSPDADLYADVIEDLALDIAEAPRLVAALIQFAQNESYDGAVGATLEAVRPLGATRESDSYFVGRNSFNIDARGKVEGGSTTRAVLGGLRSGKPPLLPRGSRLSRTGMGSSTYEDAGSLRAKHEGTLVNVSRDGVKGKPGDDSSQEESPASLVASLASFVAGAVRAAPAKLQCDSVGGGMRYWVGIGQSSIGFIPRIGDAVIDMWDTAMRNPNAPGKIGIAFRRTLQGFLLLLETTSAPNGSPAHAAATLKYLLHGGHPVASLERATGAVAYIAESLSLSPSEVQLDDAETDALGGILNVISGAAEALKLHGGVMPILEDSGRDLANRLSSMVVLGIPLRLRESALRCLAALSYARTVPILIETLASEKCAALRHWIRTQETPVGSFDVTTRVLTLLRTCVSESESCSEKTQERVAIWYIIDEILSSWSRRAYSSISQRWEILSKSAELLVDIISRNPSSSLSQKVISSMLHPAPGTGSSSYALQAICLAVGLVSRGEQMLAEYQRCWGMKLRTERPISGRNLLMHVASLGQGKTYKSMREAVSHSAKLLTLLLTASTARSSQPGLVTASAVDLFSSDAECISAASSMVYAPDRFDPILTRAGYGYRLSATVLEMLAIASQGSTLVAAILTKDGPNNSAAASKFRAALAQLLFDASSVTETHTGTQSPSSNQPGESTTVEVPILHSVLRVVEACLGPGGCAAPGMFLLGFSTNSLGQPVATEHGILGSLLELIAGAGPCERYDDAYRATAATFLERLVSQTASDTSSAVLDHIRSVSASDATVRGGGFADEMLLRMIEDILHNEELDSAVFNFSSFAILLSACMKLSALQVALFPDYERSVVDEAATQVLSNQNSSSAQKTGDIFSRFPSPLTLLRLLSEIVGKITPSVASDAFEAWNKLVGIRLSVHAEGQGYADDLLLFDMIMKLLTALSSGSNEYGLAALVLLDHGDVACSSVLDCVAKLSKSYETRRLSEASGISKDQFLTVIDGLCRALVTLSRAASRSELARTSLYGALLSCCLLPEETEVTNVLSRVVAKTSSSIGASVVELLVASACSDVLSSHSAATKSAAVALISRLVACEPSSSLQALASQNRFRRIVMSSISEMTNPASKKAGAARYNQDKSDTPASTALANSVLCLIHAVSITSSGGRLLADANCVEALAEVLKSADTNGFGGKSYRFATSPLGADHPFSSDAFGMGELESPQSRDQGVWHATLLTSLISVLAAAVRCGGENVIEEVIYAVDKGRSVFTEVLRNMQYPDTLALKAVSTLGLMLSRIPSHLISAAVTCSQLRADLARDFGRIVPPPSKSLQVGGSGSLLSVGIHIEHLDDNRTARRARLSHPEGGNLYERDIVRERALALRNIFATLIERNALPFLFSAQLFPTLAEGDVKTSSVKTMVSGSLAEVLRVGQVMLREYGRSASESLHLDRLALGDSRLVSDSVQATELAAFCEEEYSVPREILNQAHIRNCLEKESLAISLHADVCVRVLEMALIVIREYVYNAVDSVRGAPTADFDRSAEVGMTDGKVGSDMGADVASTLLSDAKVTIIPLCKEVENIQDGSRSSLGTFSRQMCRQIRAACPS